MVWDRPRLTQRLGTGNWDLVGFAVGRWQVAGGGGVGGANSTVVRYGARYVRRTSAVGQVVVLINNTIRHRM